MFGNMPCEVKGKIPFFNVKATIMSLTSEKIGAVLVANVAGQINSSNAAALEAQLLGLVDEGEHKWVLDLAQLDYISSAGLRVVLMLAKRVKDNAGRLVLCGLQPQVMEVFDISGFLALLTVVDNRDTALAQAA